jgi:signal transduction histidine kinase/DNA-binding response OmpR family regulator
MKSSVFSSGILNRLSIRKKLILAIVGISSFLLLTSLSIFISYDLHKLKKTMVEDLSALSDLIGKNNTGPLLFFDAKAANDNLLAVKVKPRVVSLQLLQEDGQVFATYSREQNTASSLPEPIKQQVNKKSQAIFYLDDHIHLLTPILFDVEQSLIGYVYIVSDREVYWQKVKEYFYTIIIMLTGSLLLALLFAHRMQKVFIQPILHLLASMQQVSNEKVYDQQLKNQYDDEFGELFQGYNEMLQQLHQHHLMTRNYQSDLEKQVEKRTIQLEKARDEALSASRTKSIFLANMSHEIRTPMNAILGYAQLLQQSEMSQEQLRQLLVIDKSGKHLLSLINDILELSKIEAGSLKLTTSDFNLTELVKNIESMFKIHCQQKNLDWILDYFSDAPVLVNGDEGKLRQVIINLVSNAIKFTDKGSIHFKVRELPNQRYFFSISDTGVGINEANLEVIFDAFHQEDPGLHRGGTGLGLNISRRYVELLAGELQVISEPEKGSTFFFDLELLPANDSFSIQEQHSVIQYHLKPGQSLHALVVDDIQDNSNLLSNLLSQMGFKVTTAENGQAAINQINHQRPDIVFMDIRMPVMDGIESIKHIRNQFSLDELKCIAVSASNIRHKPAYFIELGYNHFIAKPFHLQDIYAAIREVLEIELEDIKEQQSKAPANTKPVEQCLPNSVNLDQDFLQKLLLAAEYGQLTQLSELLPELKKYGSSGETIAQHLDLLVNTADLDGIYEYVQTLTHEQQSQPR